MTSFFQSLPSLSHPQPQFMLNKHSLNFLNLSKYTELKREKAQNKIPFFLTKQKG